MASVRRTARSAVKSNRGSSLGIALGAILSCGVVAGAAWGLASALGAMQEASRTLSGGTMRFQVAVAHRPVSEPVPTAVKSSRFLKLSDSDVRGHQLSAEAILTAHQRRIDAQLALAENARRAQQATVMASLAAVRPVAPSPDAGGSRTSPLVTALLEDTSARALEPFDLVLEDGEEPSAADEATLELMLPSVVPLPEARPAIGAVRPESASPEDKPAVRRKAVDEPAVAALPKPGFSLFGDLFRPKSDRGGWIGKNTKVAIYDVTNATVHMPDGTKLRAHSGIGIMRDNPRYEHVTMKGPTPAGIYRLSMRESRFYGVEAIRMTSIDGRHPKNRTGLLTHTNLLRGQIGSHGCVAFQNYQPFLNAFKRGQVKMLVVVPELPSSPSQLAALYRKAGA